MTDVAPNRGAERPQALDNLPLPYPVFCQPGVLNRLADVVLGGLGPAKSQPHRVAVISDTTVAEAHANQLYAHLAAELAQQLPDNHVRLFTIPPGEQEKTRERWASLTDALIEWGAGRDTTVVAVGGGVVCDLGGFVAATYMRGLPVIQVPTTLLAMVDASVGSKTAVDTPAGKNLVGAFHDPSAVVIDPLTLATLPPATLRSGLAEMIKHGVILDRSYLQRLVSALPSIQTHGAHAPEFGALIADSVRIKANVVSHDREEGGLRQILNFGHTIGHAIEKLQNYEMLHGDAIAIGMVAESRLAVRLGLAAPEVAVAVELAVRAAGLPFRLPAGTNHEAVIAATYGDKKARAGSVRYALPRAIGEMEPSQGRWSVPVDDSAVESVLLSLH